MGQIPQEHAEWAVVDRLRRMLEEPEGPFLASQSYALFASILCWVMQHARVHRDYQFTSGDRAASTLLTTLRNEPVTADPWRIWSEPAARIGGRGVQVPTPEGFENHSAARALKNLRDAMAHSDARTVQPFNRGHLLMGFEFLCSETNRKGDVLWRGRIVLLESDMRRIGCSLADRYCDAIKTASEAQQGHRVEDVAASIMEAAA